MSCCRKSKTTRTMSWPTWSVSQESVMETMPSCRLWLKPKPRWSFFPWMESSAWTISSPGILLRSTLCPPIQKTKVRGPGGNKNILVYIQLSNVLKGELLIQILKHTFSLWGILVLLELKHNIQFVFLRQWPRMPAFENDRWWNYRNHSSRSERRHFDGDAA